MSKAKVGTSTVRKSLRHRRKFAEFLKLIERTKKERLGRIVVLQPEALGDTYEELVTNLYLLSEAGLSLSFVAPALRAGVVPDVMERESRAR